MSVSLEQAIRIVPLVVGPTSVSATARSRDVAWASLRAGADGGPIRKGELVFVRRDAVTPGLLLTLMQTARAADAAGICAPGGADIAALSDKLDMPVLDLPEGMDERDAINTLLSAIVDRQQQVLKISDAIQKEMTEAVMGSGGLQHVMDALARRTNRDCCVLDGDARVLARSRGVSAAHPAVQTGYRYAHQEIDHVAEFAPFGGDSAALSVIRVGSEQFGYVAIASRRGELSDLDTCALRCACTACALHFLNQKAIVQTEMRMKGDFVWSLASGSRETLESMVARGRFLGFDLTKAYQALLLDLDDYKVYLTQMKIRDESEVQRIKERVTQIVEATAASFGRRVMVTNQHDSYIVFLEVAPGADDSEPERFARKVQESVGRAFSGLTLSCGIGRLHLSLVESHKGYAEAERALKIGRIIKGKHSVTPFEGLGSYRLLFRLADDEDAREFCDEYLGSLIEYDRKRKGELIRTLKCFIDNAGNVSATSRDLHLHRQSLLYRLERIQQLAGLDLTEPRDHFVLELSMRLLEIIRTK